MDRLLEEYAKKDIYPFHMPGHKRIGAFADEDPVWRGIYGYDITEIDGFDDLHEPTGVIRALEAGFADAYGVTRAYLSVGGSTAGVLASVFACVPPSGKIIALRGSHKSFYHAAEMRMADVRWIYPKTADDTALPFYDEADIIAALDEEPDAALLFLTSPDYYGRHIPLERVMSKARDKGVRVVIDSAHGAHLKFAPFCGISPTLYAPDYVITSIHKTLPALTQTALVLACRAEGDDPARPHPDNRRTDADRADDNPDMLRAYLDRFETSSPSYLLMAGASRCLEFLKNDAAKAFPLYKERLFGFYDATANLRQVEVMSADGRDPSKLLIRTRNRMSGSDLARVLRDDYRIETECAGLSHVLALSSVMDSAQGFKRLGAALCDIDGRFDAGERLGKEINPDRVKELLSKAFAEKRKAALSPQEALLRTVSRVSPDEAVGRIAADYILPYPPGVPFIAPGEVFDEAVTDAISGFSDAGVDIKGLKTDCDGNIFLSVVG